jgi:hypothetical protein
MNVLGWKDRAQFAEGETRTESTGSNEISDVSPDPLHARRRLKPFAEKLFFGGVRNRGREK